MKDVKTLISNFREKTTDMIKCFENEDYDKLQMLLTERQEIINLFEENPEIYNKNEIADELKKTDIMEIDRELNELIHKNMHEIKEKLNILKNDKILKQKYGSGFSGNSLFFNKKIY